jgi:DNA-binding NtrC family response regulator
MNAETGRITEPLTLVCVDEDEHVRRALKLLFEKTPMKIIVFTTGRQALDALEFQDADIFISDYFLPDMDGISLLERVWHHDCRIKRILMTTIVNDDIRLAAIRAGIDRFVEKPLTIASVDTIIGGL